MSVDLFGIEPGAVARLSRADYDRIVEAGLFEGKRIELVRGLLVDVSPQGPAHRETTRRLHECLLAAVAGRAVLYVHSPLAASEDSQPETDLSVVPPGDYRHAHPTTAYLVVEVSNTSLQYDRTTKRDLYADAGIPEYWVVDVNGLTVEVHDQLVDRRYSRTRVFRRGDTLELGALSGAKVPVDAFLG